MAKYIIEIEDNAMIAASIDQEVDELWKAKGFNSLVFDKNGLEKLTPYTEPNKESIENEVWEFAKTVSIMKPEDKRECWGTDKYNTINLGYSYQEAKARYEVWKAESEQIRVGDEVVYRCNKYVVGYVGADEVYHIVDRNWIRVVVQGDYQIFKTGRHFPEVAELLKKMVEES